MPEFSGQEVARIAGQIDVIYSKVVRLRSLELKLQPDYNIGHKAQPFTVHDAIAELYSTVRELEHFHIESPYPAAWR